jgi:hypothetical protein
MLSEQFLSILAIPLREERSLHYASSFLQTKKSPCGCGDDSQPSIAPRLHRNRWESEAFQRMPAKPF